MKKKKEEKKEPKFIPISRVKCNYESVEIPERATHVETELDSSDCWYEGDMPSVVLIFYRKE